MLSVTEWVEGARHRPLGPIQLSDPMFQVVTVTGLLEVLPVAFGVGRQMVTSELSQAFQYPIAP
jgi:hypothetical protein